MARGSFALVSCSVVLVLFAAAACESSSDDNKVTPDGGGGVFEAGPTPEAAPPVDAPADTGVACTNGGFQWATPGGGAGQYDTVHGVALDKDGSVWITGTFIGAAKWGDIALTAADDVHTTGFVAKLDPTGKVLFAKALGANLLNIGNIGERVRLDADGNAYVVGTYEKELKLGSVDLLQDNAGSAGAGFVLKLDKDGNALWGVTTANAGGSREAGRDVAIDASGDVYFTGHYNGNAKFVNSPDGGIDDIIVNAVGGDASDEAVFLAKYSQTTKKWLWAKGWSGGGNDGGLGLGVVLTADGVTVTGQINGKLDVDGTVLTAGDGGFLIKSSKDDGHVLWTTQVATKTGVNTSHAVAATSDAAGNVYIVGSFQGTATFESAATVLDAGADDAGTGAVSVTVTDTGTDMFVAKYDPNGKPLWAKHAGVSNGITSAADIAFDGADGLYVTGFKQGSPIFDATTTLAHTGNLWVARYDTSGAVKWVTGNDSPNVASGEGLAVSVRSPTSGLVIGGGFTAMPTFGSVTLTSSGEDDGVVARLCN